MDSIKRLKQGIEGVEYRVPDTINIMEYSDEEAEGEEIFAMEEAIDPKFLHTFSTDYKYEELTDEQKEVYDSLFQETEEILVREEEPSEQETVGAGSDLAWDLPRRNHQGSQGKCRHRPAQTESGGRGAETDYFGEGEASCGAVLEAAPG